MSVSIYYKPESDICAKRYAILISQERPMFNFERIDIYNPESDLSVTSYDHLNLTRASIVQFRISLYVKRLNWTFELNVMTIWISQEL